MNSEAEITSLAKENETFQKIIETQQHTINLLIDHFISGQKEKEPEELSYHLNFSGIKKSC